MSDAGPLYTLTPHACRICFGRVLMHDDAGVRTFLCSNCGASATGRAPSVICACGIKLKNGHDAGIRCEANAEPTPEFPSLIVAAQSLK